MSYLFAFIEVFASASIFCMMILFAESFLSRKVSLLSAKLLVPFAVYVIISSISMDFISNTIMSVAFLLLQFAAVHLCFDGKLLPKVIVTLGFTAIDLTYAVISSSVFQTLFHFSQEQLITPGTPYRFIYLFGTNLFEFFLMLLIYRLFHHQYLLHFKETLIILFFFANEVFSLFLCYLVLMSTETEWIKGFCAFLTFTFFVCALMVFFLISQMDRQARQLYQSRMLSLQLAEQEKQLLRYHEDNQQIQTMRHDMKRYLLNYRTLLETGSYEEIKKDIDHILKTKLTARSIVYTPNRLLNSILQHTADVCREMAVKFTTHILLPDTYQDMEAMVLISNLLDNAIEHEQNEAKEIREVQISVTTINGQMSIVVRNRISASVLSHNKNLVSTKGASASHGFGIPSVTQIVHSRKGLIDITEEDNFFIVHVLLPMIV